MFSFALICASTGSITMGRSVFLTVTGDSFAGFASKGDWFDLCTSARECVETFTSTQGRLKIPARLIWQINQRHWLCIWNILIVKCIAVHLVSFN